MTSSSIAVIGAGMAGLTAARRLADAGHAVQVFDKGRGLGGRLATRRIDGGAFDHGALLVRPRGAGFRKELEQAEAGGHAARWLEDTAALANAGGAWVGLPGMSGLLRPLAEGLSVTQSLEVTALSHHEDSWRLQTAEGSLPGSFSHLILAIPQPQALRLLEPWPLLAAQLLSASMRPNWAGLFAFEAPLPAPADFLAFEEGPIRHLVRNSAKPGREGPLDCWVVQASDGWSSEHLEWEKPEAAAALLAALFDALGVPPREAVYAAGHRWRFGFTDSPLGEACLQDPGSRLAVCGDWCLGPKVEDARDSGEAAAQALLAML